MFIAICRRAAAITFVSLRCSAHDVCIAFRRRHLPVRLRTRSCHEYSSSTPGFAHASSPAWLRTARALLHRESVFVFSLLAACCKFCSSAVLGRGLPDNEGRDEGAANEFFLDHSFKGRACKLGWQNQRSRSFTCFSRSENCSLRRETTSEGDVEKQCEIIMNNWREQEFDCANCKWHGRATRFHSTTIVEQVQDAYVPCVRSQ